MKSIKYYLILMLVLVANGCSQTTNEIKTTRKALQIACDIFNSFFDNTFEIKGLKIIEIEDNSFYSVVLFSSNEILIDEID